MNSIYRVVALSVVTIYFLLTLMAALFQDRLVFSPSRVLSRTPSSIGLHYDTVSFPSLHGEHLSGWFITHPKPKFTLLFFQGKGGNMSNHLPLIQLFHELQVTVFIFDYQGYGKSEGLTCSEEKTRADALGAWYYLTRNRGIPEKKIIVFGRSLGAAIASQLCTEINPMGLILEAPFLSAKAMAKLLYPYFPSSLLLKYDFDNRKALPKLRLPKLILHSRDDQLVPFSHGKLLFDVALPPKQFTSLKGGHGNSFSVSNPTYTAAVSSFLNTLLQTPLKQ